MSPTRLCVRHLKIYSILFRFPKVIGAKMFHVSFLGSQEICGYNQFGFFESIYTANHFWTRSLKWLIHWSSIIGDDAIDNHCDSPIIHDVHIKHILLSESCYTHWRVTELFKPVNSLYPSPMLSSTPPYKVGPSPSTVFSIRRRVKAAGTSSAGITRVEHWSIVGFCSVLRKITSTCNYRFGNL